MQIEPGLPPPTSRGSSARIKELLIRAVAVVVGAAMLVGAFILSIAFFAVALALVVVFGGYLWWKTRHLRRQFRAGAARQRDVIEGTAEDVSGPDRR